MYHVCATYLSKNSTSYVEGNTTIIRSSIIVKHTIRNKFLNYFDN